MEQYNVTGMSCAACSARVEKAVSAVPGVTSCSVSLLTNSMGVEGTASTEAVIKAVQDAGYGASFAEWLVSANPKPYGSFGNGSAMRVSYAGWIAKTLEEAERLAEITALVTHNHSEGIKGAKVIAGCIFLLKDGASKEDVREYASKYYNLDFTLDDIREYYFFDATCKGSVPEAIKAFLEGEDFADVISLALSIGGDSDTIAAIAGSLAEAIYPIPQELRGSVIDKLDKKLLSAISDAVDYIDDRLSKRR